ncbi:PLP-dependent aminotransferase family protein [Paenibacillus sp. UNC499MF]|uniref:MocR-like pyridoxine biosynthesis transcription factor PdxR n=1 Tax=Paenibacillus sp. UNC499MF TaxID=1502751 RepID=UPI00089FA7DA|nr:PLP-dependent aminotransferase family protein [Paenibacillus sp. UNC499MF]SEG56812.1 GntR family transcriptional regulator / MocR family aminotransferase [Paenibacillus sp. UNC499MF]
MREFTLDFSASPKPIFHQLYTYFKNGIRKGKLRKGDYLPSIRSCARSFGISKNTVESAYQLLVSEGYLRNIAKKGFCVTYEPESNEREAAPAEAEDAGGFAAATDFRYGNIELGTFPFRHWNKVRNLVIAQNQSRYAVEGTNHGEYPLRKELSRLLYESRGVTATPDQIVVGAAPQQLVMLLCQLLDAKKHRIGVENPGYDGARNTFLNLGFGVHPVSLTGSGVSLGELTESGANVMYVSPSQQFRNRIIMSADKRAELADWTRSLGEYLIEDDYEWEFKYEEGILPAIQSMIPEKAVYIGRISKALLPVFNLSYMVLPSGLLSEFHSKIPEYDQPVSKLDQLTFARYLSDGYWYKHLQQMRRLYEEKQRYFSEALERYMPEKARAEGKDTGLHAFLTVRTDRSEEELIEAALEKGVRVYGTARYWLRPGEEYPTILLGYGALGREEIAAGVKALAEAWF